MHLSILLTDCWIWRTLYQQLLDDSRRWGWPSDWLVVCQGKPTQAMKEAEPLQYGQLTAKDYIPGAEILPETSEVKEPQEEQGDTTRNLDLIHVNCSFISTLDLFIVCCLLESHCVSSPPSLYQQLFSRVIPRLSSSAYFRLWYSCICAEKGR